jgi:hypothetical protein
MTTVYSQTATLALALIVMPVTIFVFGVSMLGRALKRAEEKEKLLLDHKKDAATKSLAAYKSALQEATAGSSTTGDLGKKVAVIQEQLDSTERNLKSLGVQAVAARESARCLTVTNCVVYPVLSFLICFALALAAASLHGSSTLPEGWVATLVPPGLWLFGLASAFLGFVRFVMPSLRKIQEVAVQSDEVFQKSTVEAMMTALEGHEEARRPKLVMVPDYPSFKVTPTARSDFTLSFSLFLEKGFVGEHCTVLFFTHDGSFQFRGRKTFVQGAGRPWPDALTMQVSFDRIQRGVIQPLELPLTAPDQPGKHVLGYYVLCDGFKGELETITITVTQAEDAKS